MATRDALEDRRVRSEGDPLDHAVRDRDVDERPGAAWFHRGEAKVLFDFAVADGAVQGITFRADPAGLERVARRQDTARGT